MFDFDGTLTARDTSLPFLAFAAGRARLTASLVLGMPFFVADLTVALGQAALRRGGDAVRGPWELAVHGRLLRALLDGKAREDISELGRRFAEGLDAMITPLALEQLAWHRLHGHECVLVTASLDSYADPWGRRVGFHHVLASRLAHGGDGSDTVHGGFDGEPCRGEAKVHQLREAVGPLDRYTVVVYGNELADRALLDAADHPVRVRDRASWARLSAEVRATLHGV